MNPEGGRAVVSVLIPPVSPALCPCCVTSSHGTHLVRKHLSTYGAPASLEALGSRREHRRAPTRMVFPSRREMKSPSQNLCEFELRRTRRDPVTADTRRLGIWGRAGQEWAGGQRERPGPCEGAGGAGTSVLEGEPGVSSLKALQVTGHGIW